MFTARTEARAAGTFLQRYFAIGWVVALRWAAAVLAIAAVLFGVMAAVEADMESTQWYEFVLFAVAETIYYWRLGHHIKDLAARAATAS